MLNTEVQNPFHAGELEAQTRAGVGNVAQWAGGFIRDFLPAQHRNFHTSLPFLVMSGSDLEGRTWITLVDGEEGFIGSPDVRSLTLNTDIDDQDPLAQSFSAGTDVGVIGIEMATRRRNRFSGHMKKSDTGYAINIRQTFGNCPQYIHEREWERVADNKPAKAINRSDLSQSQIALIQKSDTMFIGSGHQKGEDVPSRGYDASHRGGAPGFVRVSDSKTLHIPDYAGNNFFNTIGNLITDPRVGLVFVDFETGGLLQITGRANIDWNHGGDDPAAWRTINVEIDAVVERPSALALRWKVQDNKLRRLKISQKVKEANNITSFYLSSADGLALERFDAGQHLPIEVQIPGQAETSKRTYTLSGSPEARDEYRLSIKREEHGVVSRFFHDEMDEGAILEASNPSGNFVIPDSDSPLVLISAGVGITPMISMLHATVDEKSERPVWFVHGTQNSKEHALHGELEEAISQHSSAEKHIFYSRPLETDKKGRDYDVDGRITVQALIDMNAGASAQYLLCGPARFMSEIRSGLEAAGVSSDNIHMEAFGPSS
ncbi:MAG: pyridoxamine 5'-phosphate oxidase family protein [Pseudomonadota bacterium]